MGQPLEFGDKIHESSSTIFMLKELLNRNTNQKMKYTLHLVIALVVFSLSRANSFYGCRLLK